MKMILSIMFWQFVQFQHRKYLFIDIKRRKIVYFPELEKLRQKNVSIFSVFAVSRQKKRNHPELLPVK